MTITKTRAAAAPMATSAVHTAVGGLPITVTVNPATHTVYVANANDNNVSFFSTRRR